MKSTAITASFVAIACSTVILLDAAPTPPANGTANTPPAPALGNRGNRGGNAASTPQVDPATLRKEWVDETTGHRLFRISTENGSSSLYFHYNAYSSDGKKVVFNSPAGIMATDLATKATTLVVPGASVMETARKSNDVYYRAQGAIMAADLDTKAARKIIDIPQGLQISCVNADGTLFAGVITNAAPPTGAFVAKPDSIPGDQLPRMFPGKTAEQLTAEQRLSVEKENRLATQLRQAVTAENPRCLFTLNAKTGEVKRFGYAHAWLNHLQFSPTDPDLLMFCHEGTWHETNRVWILKGSDDKTPPTAMHQRTMDMEIWGHEGFVPDGKSIYYDLQTPRSVQFWLVVQDLASLKETRYSIDKNEWGIHFFVSHDGKKFISDGSDAGQVAFAPDGMWLNLFTMLPDGKTQREKLVNMSKHNYVTSASQPGNTGVEPNATFSPDDKYVTFTGTFDGARHVYLVETAKK